MKNWEEIGQALFKEELTYREALWSRVPSEKDSAEFAHRYGLPYEHVDVEGRRARNEKNRVAFDMIRDHQDLSGLIAYLRSDHPLDREWLADHLEWMMPSDPAGRQRNDWMWELVEITKRFYREWQRRNREAGIRERGLSKQMKYLSCVYSIGVWASWRDPIPKPEVLLGNLNRSKNHGIKK
jgi:hypothetical protein